MKRKTRVLIALALVCGLGASYTKWLLEPDKRKGNEWDLKN